MLNVDSECGATDFSISSGNGHSLPKIPGVGDFVVPEVAMACCRIGVGEVLSSYRESPMMPLVEGSNFAFSIPDIPRDQVLLTPRESSHPIFGGVVQRALADGRSFSLTDDTSRVSQTLVIKGGDLLYRKGIQDALGRIQNGQLPGGGGSEELSIQFKNAQQLHKLALEQEGGIAGLPIPHSVRSLHAVPTEDGEMLSVREFLDSPHYLSPMARREFHIPDHMALSKLLLDLHELEPAEYLYLLDGPNLRCHELAGLLLFHDCEASLAGDPLVRDSLLPAYGVALEQMGHDRDSIVRGVYRLLGEVWDVPLSYVLPMNPITDENYREVLDETRSRYQEYGLSLAILEPFAERLMETVALAHAHGITFSPINTKLAGSLHPRNVTVSATVCDLDTVGSFLGDARYFRKDLGEAMLTVSSLYRMLTAPDEKTPGHIRPEELVDHLYALYHEYLDLFHGEFREKAYKASQNEYLHGQVMKLFV